MLCSAGALLEAAVIDQLYQGLILCMYLTLRTNTGTGDLAESRSQLEQGEKGFQPYWQSCHGGQ